MKLTPNNTTEESQTGSGPGVWWDHAGLNVLDVDAAVSWYGEVLGFELERRFGVGDLKGAMLVHPSGTRLELIHRDGQQQGIRASGPGEAALTTGFGHIAFQVNDLDAVYARALKAGASERVAPTDAPRPGARMAWLADHEGNLIELITPR